MLGGGGSSSGRGSGDWGGSHCDLPCPAVVSFIRKVLVASSRRRTFSYELPWHCLPLPAFLFRYCLYASRSRGHSFGVFMYLFGSFVFLISSVPLTRISILPFSRDALRSHAGGRSHLIGAEKWDAPSCALPQTAVESICAGLHVRLSFMRRCGTILHVMNCRLVLCWRPPTGK